MTDRWLPMLAGITDKHAVSRRTVLIGVASIVAIAAVGEGVIISRIQSPHVRKVTTQKPTPIPQGQLFFTFRGAFGNVWTVAWSRTGKWIASGSGSPDNTVQVWNASDGSQVSVYLGHSDQVISVTWSPDGKRIASGSLDGTVQVWNASNGSQIFTYRGHSSAVHTVAWSPDGEWIASGSGETWAASGVRIASASVDFTVQVWNASNGSKVFTYRGHFLDVNAVAWSPDGKLVASGSGDNTVQVWNASNGSQIFTYKRHSAPVNAVAWSPDGKLVASGSWDRTVQVWNASNGSQVFAYKGHPDGVSTVAWSPDGQQIASGGNKTVQVWNASGGSHIFTYQGHPDRVSRHFFFSRI